jgi:hypothetical protein
MEVTKWAGDQSKVSLTYYWVVKNVVYAACAYKAVAKAPGLQELEAWLIQPKWSYGTVLRKDLHMTYYSSAKVLEFLAIYKQGVNNVLPGRIKMVQFKAFVPFSDNLPMPLFIFPPTATTPALLQLGQFSHPLRTI